MAALKDCLSKAVVKLEAAGIEDSLFNARCMASELLKVPISRLLLMGCENVDDHFQKQLEEMTARRCSHEPLQYIVGNWCFMDLELKVGPGVLIPRPETEEVFEAAKKWITGSGLPESFRFADVGTGTGALGIAAAMEFTKAGGYLVDISDAALSIAEQNLKRYPEAASRLSLVKCSLLSAFAPESLDLVISNPPYIDSADIPLLMPEVKDFEPILALDGGKNGTILIDELIKQSASVLKNGGLLVFEHGDGQREAIKQLVTNDFEICCTGDDLSGRQRYFVLKRSNR